LSGVAVCLAFAPQRSSQGAAGYGAPVEIQTALEGIFREERCVTAKDARTEILSRASPSTFSNWTIADGTVLRPDQCVAARVEVEARRIALLPALSPIIRARMEEVTQALIRRCYSKDAAVGYVMRVLTGLGEEDFEVRTDGPLTAPVDQLEDVKARVSAGCWVYSGTGWNQRGHRYYYVSGLEAP
jgi:hypothetical protein